MASGCSVGDVLAATTRANRSRESDDLEEWLATAIGRRRRSAVSIRALRRAPDQAATLSSVEMLEIDLTDGSCVRLFVKHVGDEEAGHPDKQVRDREIRVYDELLGLASLPVPYLYGWRAIPKPGQANIFLEYIDATNLTYHGLEVWHTVMRSLARLHSHFANEVQRLERAPFLLKLDAEYFDGWSTRALAAVTKLYPKLTGEAQAVVRWSQATSRLLEQQPVTLVHNDLAPKNALVGNSGSRPGVTFVDWELAGVGCAWLDVVHLSYGFDDFDTAALEHAYRSSAHRSPLIPASEHELRRVVAACALHKTLYRIARCGKLRAPEARVAHWLSAATTLATAATTTSTRRRASPR